MTLPLRAYWWNKSPNFGDALSRDVLEYVSGRPVAWAAEPEAEAFAVGSIMWHVRKGVQKRGKDAAPPVIWGSGCMEPMNTDWCDRARIVALRGPVTAAVLNRDPLPMGDPGILSPRVAGPVDRGDEVGLILHYSQMNDATLAQLGDRDGLKIIDVRSSDAKAVIRQIASCRHIFSQSLHGLIVADAYGIPNQRIEGSDIHRSAQFKFYDYAASLGRDPMVPIGLRDVADAVRALPATPAVLPYASRLHDMADALVDAFPSDLKATA